MRKIKSAQPLLEISILCLSVNFSKSNFLNKILKLKVILSWD